jgi:hypothetical protein
VRDGGGSCYGCHSGGGGGISKAVVISAESAIAEANNSALLGFLVWFFGEGAGGDSQHDASLWGSRTLD